MLDIDVSWVNGNYQRILFHSVRTASADRVREMAAPRRHLALGVLPAPDVARHRSTRAVDIGMSEAWLRRSPGRRQRAPGRRPWRCRR